MEAANKLGRAGSFCSRFPALLHFFTSSLFLSTLFTVHCPLFTVFQITFAQKSPQFCVQPHERKEHDRFLFVRESAF